MNKRFFIYILAVLMASGLFCGCAKSKEDGERPLRVVCTIFPQYDWVRQILGSRAGEVELTLLLDNGADLHNYQPLAEDIVTISACGLFIYVGGESDGWVSGVLSQALNKNMTVISLMDVLGEAVMEEELLAGMEDHESEEEEGEESGPEYDEHVWLSLKNARVVCKAIANALSALDPENAQLYASSFNAYAAELSALDAEYQSVVDGAARKTLLFADRFPFRYPAQDYGLSCYAAFAGCSAETEASFETIIFLAGKVNELELPAVLVIEGSGRTIADTVISSTAKKNQKVLVMNSLQSVTGANLADGTSDLSVMRENLEVLKTALN